MCCARVLVCSMLHLTGYKVTMDDLKNFRQIDSITAGHPENTLIPVRLKCPDNCGEYSQAPRPTAHALLGFLSRHFLRSPLLCSRAAVVWGHAGH